MATLFVRTRKADDGSRRYSVIYRRGGRYYPTEHAGTFKTLVADMLAAGLNPKVELTRKLTPGRKLEDVAHEWLDGRRSLAEGTRSGHRHRLPVILEAFDRVDEITVDDVAAWVGELEGRYKPGTVRLFVQELRLILDHADLPTNPARSKRVELPREVRGTLQPPTASQVTTAAGKLATDLVAPVLVMEQLGLRVSETLSLKPADVDQDGARVRVRGETAKTGRARWVPAPDLLLDALMDRLPFTGTRGRVGSALRHVEAGFSPHDLRHRRASLWSAQGVPPAQAAAWLGHTVPVYLGRYTHVLVDSEIPVQDLASLLR